MLSEEIIDAMMEREEEVAERLKKQAAATAKTQENGDASEPTGDSAADGKATGGLRLSRWPLGEPQRSTPVRSGRQRCLPPSRHVVHPS